MRNDLLPNCCGRNWSDWGRWLVPTVRAALAVLLVLVGQGTLFAQSKYCPADYDDPGNWTKASKANIAPNASWNWKLARKNGSEYSAVFDLANYKDEVVPTTVSKKSIDFEILNEEEQMRQENLGRGEGPVQICFYAAAPEQLTAILEVLETPTSLSTIKVSDKKATLGSIQVVPAWFYQEKAKDVREWPDVVLRLKVMDAGAGATAASTGGGDGKPAKDDKAAGDQAPQAQPSVSENAAGPTWLYLACDATCDATEKSLIASGGASKWKVKKGVEQQWDEAGNLVFGVQDSVVAEGQLVLEYGSGVTAYYVCMDAKKPNVVQRMQDVRALDAKCGREGRVSIKLSEKSVKPKDGSALRIAHKLDPAGFELKGDGGEHATNPIPIDKLPLQLESKDVRYWTDAKIELEDVRRHRVVEVELKSRERTLTIPCPSCTFEDIAAIQGARSIAAKEQSGPRSSVSPPPGEKLLVWDPAAREMVVKLGGNLATSGQKPRLVFSVDGSFYCWDATRQDEWRTLRRYTDNCTKSATVPIRFDGAPQELFDSIEVSFEKAPQRVSVAGGRITLQGLPPFDVQVQHPCLQVAPENSRVTWGDINSEGLRLKVQDQANLQTIWVVDDLSGEAIATATVNLCRKGGRGRDCVELQRWPTATNAAYWTRESRDWLRCESEVEIRVSGGTKYEDFNQPATIPIREQTVRLKPRTDDHVISLQFEEKTLRGPKPVRLYEGDSATISCESAPNRSEPLRPQDAAGRYEGRLVCESGDRVRLRVDAGKSGLALDKVLSPTEETGSVDLALVGQTLLVVVEDSSDFGGASGLHIERQGDDTAQQEFRRMISKTFEQLGGDDRYVRRYMRFVTDDDGSGRRSLTSGVSWEHARPRANEWGQFPEWRGESDLSESVSAAVAFLNELPRSRKNPEAHIVLITASRLTRFGLNRVVEAMDAQLAQCNATLLIVNYESAPQADDVAAPILEGKIYYLQRARTAQIGFEADAGSIRQAAESLP